MAQKWWFKSKDGVALFPDITGKDVQIDRWTGSSRWHFRTKNTMDDPVPAKMEYYVTTVVFRLQGAVEKRGGQVSQQSLEEAEKGVYKKERDIRCWSPRPCVNAIQ